MGRSRSPFFAATASLLQSTFSSSALSAAPPAASWSRSARSTTSLSRAPVRRISTATGEVEGNPHRERARDSL